MDHLADHDIFADEERALAPPVAPVRAVAGQQRPVADQVWRQEIVSRVQQHRARRRRPADPNAMELNFPADAAHSFGMEPEDGLMPPPPERFHEIVIPQNMVKPVMGKPEPPKVIRFPRTQPAYIPTVEEVMLDELEAAPAPDAPRIWEAYDAEPTEVQFEQIESIEIEPVARPSLQGQQMELLPSFSDIQLEPEEARIDRDSEVIPRPAPMRQRLVSGLVDAGIVFIATAAFTLTFLEVAEEVPHAKMTLPCMLAAGGIFWLLFQYIFLVYRRATPGMNFAQLELCTFEGKATTMFERQCRAAASALSGFSLGLGYAWALVDEDRMGWHDRISRTHVRARSEIPTLSPPKGREPYYYDDMKG
ncbi:MAG TPA: RDD family protein [Candidatus Polarisedimenticolia bacterium]|nr:RDD family protein [Candidatus Polarisedimenticolia bacterium]